MYGGYSAMGGMGGMYGGGLGMGGGYGSMMGGYGGGMGGYGSMGMSGMGGMGGYGSGFGSPSTYGAGGLRRGLRHRGGATNHLQQQSAYQGQYGGDMTTMMGGGYNEPLPSVPSGGANSNSPNGRPAITDSSHGGAVQTFNNNNNSGVTTNETKEERRLRVRREKRIERAQRAAEVEDRRMQRRAFYLSAAMEMLSNATQIVVHMLRSCYELASILFGTYYSVQAMRSFFASQQQHDATRLIQDFVTTTPSAAGPHQAAVVAATTASGASVWLSRIKKVGLLFGAITLSEMLLRTYRQRQDAAMRRQRHHHHNTHSSSVEELDDEELEDIYNKGSLEEDSGMSSDSEWSEVDEEEDGKQNRNPLLSSSPSSTQTRRGAFRNGSRRVYTVTHDFVPTQESDPDGMQLEVNAGDEVVLDGPYSDSKWCEATVTDANGGQRRGFVPGNFLKLLSVPQKF